MTTQHTSKLKTHLLYSHLQTLSLSDNYKNSINNQIADVILSNRTSHAHALSPVERVRGHFLWEQGAVNVTISWQKIDFVT